MFLLDQYRWYRKLRGGPWYNITPYPFPYMHFWQRNPPISWLEKVNAVEVNGVTVTKLLGY